MGALLAVAFVLVLAAASAGLLVAGSFLVAGAKKPPGARSRSADSCIDTARLGARPTTESRSRGRAAFR